MTGFDTELTARVADFLFLEAELLDERRYDDWLDLYSGEAIYWVPANDFDGDPARKVSIYYDDHRRLKERVIRLKSPRFWAQNPPSRTARSVTNVRVSRDDADLLVSSKFMLMELRHGISTSFAGSYRHRLAETAGGFHIRRKEVLLIQNDQPFYNLTFIF